MEFPQYHKRRLLNKRSMDNRFFSRSPYDSNISRFVSTDFSDNIGGSGVLMSECWKHANAVDDLIKSYDHFIEEGVNDVLSSYPLEFNRIAEDGTVVPNKRYNVNLVRAVVPTMTRTLEDGTVKTELVTPEYAHLQNLTLMTSLVAEIVEESWDLNTEEWIELDRDTLEFGKVPTMVRSKYCNTGGLTNRELYEIGECPTWPGGYFIAKGTMCTITMKQKLRSNRFLIYMDNKFDTNVGTVINSIPTGTTKLSILKSKDDGLMLWSNFIRYSASGKPSPINIFFLLAVLHKFVYGITDFSREDYDAIIDNILEYVGEADRPMIMTLLGQTLSDMGSLLDNYNILISEFQEACNMSTSHTELDLLATIRQSLFPQYNLTIDNVEEADQYKYYQLCYYIAKYSQYLVGSRPMDDRNSISNCMFETPGIALRGLFRDIYKNHVTDLLNDSISRIPDMSMMRQFVNKVGQSITKQFESAIRSNTWGARKGTQSQQMVERLRLDTVLLLYSEITKISIPTSKKGSQLKVRENHQSQCGYIDYVNAPESDAVGLTNHKAITCQFSLTRSDDDIIEVVQQHAVPLFDKSPSNPDDSGSSSVELDTMVFVNGKLLGRVNGQEMERILITMRREREIPFDTMIEYDRMFQELHVHTDGGRAVRPLLIVNPETNNLVINEKNLWGASFEQLLEHEAIEYIDAAEQEYAMIATSPASLTLSNYSNDDPIQYTHCEMDPNVVLGVSAACIPLANHNMSTKNSYAANMMHQGIGTPGINYYNRFDTAAKILDAPTRPIVEPQMARLTGLSQLPFGRGVIVAYMAYNGWNQEDAIIVNRGSLERGVFNFGVYYKYDFEETFQANNVQVRIQPVAETDTSPIYRGLGEDGIIRVGTKVKAGDVLVRAKRLSTQLSGEGVQYDDVDLRVKYGEYGTVRRVEISESAGRRTIKIRIEDNRNVLNSIDFVGDKLASRAATKGVIGRAIDELEIPYTTTGMRPDIIINPLGVPTRAPVNKLIEILAAKGHVMVGDRVDGTSFNSPQRSIEKSQEYLERFGFSNDGEEMMIDPRTGRELSVTYIGPCHYMMLTHYAVDKIQGQGQIGRKIIATNQPRKGRKNEGGIRFGEGERDALVAYSNSLLVNDTMCKSSDEYSCVLCVDCGKETALKPLPDQSPSCVNCSGQNLRTSSFSGGYKYLNYMTTGLNIDISHDIE